MASSGKPVLGDVAKEFKEWRTYANNSFRKLVDSLSHHEKWDRDNLRMNLQEGDKVPGATFTELLIRNEIQKKRSKIVSRPTETTQPDTRHVSGVDHQNATKEISDILTNFENVYRETEANLRKELEDKNNMKKNILSVQAFSRDWHSRMIAVVLDADTGIIVTGATKPVAPEIPIFQDAADNISRIRVGEDFGSIIDDCSKDVWKLFKSKDKSKKLSGIQRISPNRALVTEELATLYDDIVNANKGSVASYQNILPSRNAIMSWAFGIDFTFRPPCTRCQRLYSGWLLYNKPDTPEEKLAGLKRDYDSGSLKYSSGTKYPCSYCAETVAAAKLHALYRGTLTLVLPKDTDKTRASDKVRA